MTPRPRILLDCDPGIDDAFAIFVALRYCDLAAVTTVSGNVPIEHTTRNALHVLELAGADTPVHQGAARPLTGDPKFAEGVHGVAGLGNRPTPEPQRAVDPTDATQAIVEHCRESGAIVVATGPLTNVALALEADPSIAGRIGHLHWMGGAHDLGNVTPFAEFNAWADPEAVDVVLRSAMPLTMYGLDLTHQLRFGKTEVEFLRDAATPTSAEAAEYLEFYEEHGVQDGQGQPMHDPCAVLGATHRDLFETAPSHIVVQTEAEERGQTIVRDAMTDSTHHHAARIDALTARSLVLDAVVCQKATDA